MWGCRCGEQVWGSGGGELVWGADVGIRCGEHVWGAGVDLKGGEVMIDQQDTVYMPT